MEALGDGRRAVSFLVSAMKIQGYRRSEQGCRRR